MASPSTSIEWLHETASAVCVACDYLRQGLSPGAVCPECGAANDRDIVSLAGWRKPPFFTWGVKGWLLASAIGGYLLFTIRKEITSPRQMIDDWVALLLMLALYGYAFSRFFTYRPPMRLRLSLRGWELVERRSPVRLRRWEPALPVVVEPVKGGLCKLRIDWKQPTMSNAGTQTFCFVGEPAQAEAIKRFIDAQTQPLRVKPDALEFHI